MMARILITGSSDGLGLLAAQTLVKRGHKVVLHARNTTRARDAEKACPGAETVVVGDLSSIKETKKLASDINALGRFDAIVHNAGLYFGGCRMTSEGFPALVAVNTFAPYILTCLINKPKKLVYLSSGYHASGDPSLKDIAWKERGESAWSDSQGYANSKMHNVMFAKAIARKWRDVQSTSMDPGWQPTKMGGKNAPGDLQSSVSTYVMLVEEDIESGKYFKPGRREAVPSKFCEDIEAQDKLLRLCETFTGVSLPN
ncbi:uncharacterized protein PV09_06084 [Verruconis gallopava]|uniref:Uncharacterized protein n=1 Tax=Verruconis gallopava TaxID=253628 RepID=A0A0D2A7U9_9PEZI|nr:uncharacterized protein PV09_06084 [Verruconis gallopava]KIW02645.1 hypothetical protein PV09_06084 [Verruconis gallopava]